MRNEDKGRDRSTVVINRLRETCKNVTAGGAVKCKHIRRDVTSKKKWLIFRLYFKKTLVNELYNVGQFLMYYIFGAWSETTLKGLINVALKIF